MRDPLVEVLRAYIALTDAALRMNGYSLLTEAWAKADGLSPEAVGLGYDVYHAARASRMRALWDWYHERADWVSKAPPLNVYLFAAALRQAVDAGGLDVLAAALRARLAARLFAAVSA